MTHRDRHGRLARVDTDPQRRPVDGSRARSLRRFTTLVDQAVSGLPPDLRPHAAAAEVIITDVPDPDGGDVDLHGAVTLARLLLPGPQRQRAQLHVFRRALELRADTPRRLAADVRRAVHDAVNEALGHPPEDP